jgi:glutathione S-transferase
MKLYYAPGACSLGIHVLLEEIGQPYDTHKINMQAGEQTQPAFLAINPKGKVPAVEFEDGSVLTEWPAIASYLAYAPLVPHDKKAAGHAMETVNFINGTMHADGFRRIFRPGGFTPNEADQPAVKAKGLEIFTQGFEMMAKLLGDKDYLFGAFSIADAALFYVTFWAGFIKLPVPDAISAHHRRMLARPAVQTVLKAEGLA